MKENSLKINNALSIELCHYLTSVLLLESKINKNKDLSVPDALASIQSNVFSDTILENVWPFLENIIKEELIPTYSYLRLYKNNNILPKHIDKTSCEISMTIQLGRSHNYVWPIFIGKNKFELAEGDGIIYKGYEVPHWREKCKGPDGYYSGHLFLHYVKANGKFKELAGNKRWKKHPFIRSRSNKMNTK